MTCYTNGGLVRKAQPPIYNFQSILNKAVYHVATGLMFPSTPYGYAPRARIKVP